MSDDKDTLAACACGAPTTEAVCVACRARALKRAEFMATTHGNRHVRKKGAYKQLKGSR